MIRRLLLLALLTSVVRATDYTNTTGTYLDVNALMSGTVVGDRVFVVGPVSNTWSSILSFPSSSVQLIATNDVIVTRTNSGKIINLGTTDYTRVSGFTFYHYGTSSSDSIIYTKGQGVYVDHCNLWSGNNIKKIGIYPDGVNTSDSPNGCAYACYFDRTRMLDHVGGICHQPPGCLPAALEWAAPDRRGTTNQWVLENCTFRQVQSTLHNSTDDEYAGTYTVRFSTFTNTTAEAHSNGSGQLPQERANRSVEIYGNTFIQQPPVNLGSPAMFIRGGTGGAFSNTVTGIWPSTTKVIKFDAERGFSGAGQGQSPVDGNNPISDHGTGTHTGPNGASILTDATASWPVGSLVNGTGVHAFWLYNLTQSTHYIITANTATTVTSSNVWNTGDSYKITGGYPLRDQISTFQDASPWLLTNSPPVQTLVPLYYTANTINGNPAGIFIDPASTFWVQDGRDVTNATPPWTLLTYPHPLVTFYGTNSPPPPPVVTNGPPIDIGGGVRLRGGVNLHTAP